MPLIPSTEPVSLYGLGQEPIIGSRPGRLFSFALIGTFHLNRPGPTRRRSVKGILALFCCI